MRHLPTSLPLVLIVALTLAGCGLFGGQRASYEDSVAGRPLEVPPGLDDPGRTSALTIPGVSAERSESRSSEVSVGAPPSAGTSAFGPARVRINDSVAGVWSRVGLALERSGVGEVIARDEAALTYTVRGRTVMNEPVERGFLGRLLGRPKTRAVESEAVRVVRIRPDGKASEVVIEDEAGNAANDDLARRIAEAIQRRLG